MFQIKSEHLPSTSSQNPGEKAKKDEDLENSFKDLKAENRRLRINMSILLATSKAEIERKDKLIHEIRKDLDSYLFKKRKLNVRTCETFTQTESRTTEIDDVDKTSNQKNEYPRKGRSRSPTRDSHSDRRNIRTSTRRGSRDRDYKSENYGNERNNWRSRSKSKGKNNNYDDKNRREDKR